LTRQLVFVEISARFAQVGDDDAHLMLAAPIGSILLARAVDDPRLSDGILESAARALHRYVEERLRA
jgi:hypothetical protein